MADRPPNIRLFETVQIVSIIVGVIHSFIVFDDVFDVTIEAIAALALTLVISRGRKNWARWVLATSFIISVLLMIWQWDAIFETGFPLITIGVMLAQFAAVALLFTHEASAWLSGRSAPT